MQGSQADNFRTHLKTHSKTQNCYTFSSQARLFLLRSCIECVNNLVTVASEMLTVTINFSKIQQCCSQSTEGSHRIPNPQFLLNIVQKWRGGGSAGQTHVKEMQISFLCRCRASPCAEILESLMYSATSGSFPKRDSCTILV